MDLNLQDDFENHLTYSEYENLSDLNVKKKYFWSIQDTLQAYFSRRNIERTLKISYL